MIYERKQLTLHCTVSKKLQSFLSFKKSVLTTLKAFVTFVVKSKL